jgi:hypothetical protein
MPRMDFAVWTFQDEAFLEPANANINAYLTKPKVPKPAIGETIGCSICNTSIILRFGHIVW